MVAVPSWVPATQIAVVVAVVASFSVVWWLDRDRGWGPRRRSRLLLGVPWGTVVSIVGVVCVYLFVQGGLDHWGRPLTIPFRAWSYFYPLGMATAPFAHAGPNHLVGNLIGTLVLGTLAEYAWGHFPEARGESAFSSPRTNPYVRAFVLFPAGVAAVGILASLLSWGPVIGFSGVVFAFAGFALVRYPVATVVALVADDVVRVVYRALHDPVLLSKAEPQFVRPWWVGVSVQGHVLGLVLGVVAGALLLRRREGRAMRLWGGALLIAVSLSLWAIWWFRDNVRFVLLRWVGVVFVFVLATLLSVGILARDADGTVFSVPTRQVGVLLLVFPVLVIGFVAVPLNLATVADPTPPGETAIEVGDYTVTYAENVTNQQISVLNLSVLDETTRVNTSGVIVISDERHIWTRAVSTSRLAFDGTRAVRVGGPGWRETVYASRRGWTVPGNGTAYVIWLKPPGGDWRTAFHSEPAVADPVIAGRRVAVRPEDGNFSFAVRRNGSAVATTAIPPPNRTASAGGIRFARENDSVYAVHNETRVRVAEKETYE